MLNLLPLVPGRGLGDLGVLGAVDDDLLWHDPLLEHALLGVLPAAAEEAGRLDAEVADLLLVPVDEAEPVLGLDLLVLLLLRLLLFLAAVLAGLTDLRNKN